MIDCFGLIPLKTLGQPVCRTANTLTSAIQNVRVNHCLTNVAVPQKFLNGIDAPEKKQAFGAKSKARLGELVAGKDVMVEWKEKDTYGRTMGKVTQNGVDVNLQMVKEGLAWYYRKYSKSAELSRAEAEAKAGKKGLWADQNPVPPWDFRKHEKKKK